MTGRAPTRPRGSKAASTTPINFRMPSALRSRLRRFAEERSLGEAEALRLAVSERLNQIDEERELEAAERWQFEQAYASWQRYLRNGRRRTVSRDAIDRIFERALADIPPKRVQR